MALSIVELAPSYSLIFPLLSGIRIVNSFTIKLSFFIHNHGHKLKNKKQKDNENQKVLNDVNPVWERRSIRQQEEAARILEEIRRERLVSFLASDSAARKSLNPI